MNYPLRGIESLIAERKKTGTRLIINEAISKEDKVELINRGYHVESGVLQTIITWTNSECIWDGQGKFGGI